MSHEHDHIPAAGDDPVHAGHAHGPSRDGELKGVSDGRLLWTVLLNQILTVGQVVAGIFSGSVALLSDAAHNFNDANATANRLYRPPDLSQAGRRAVHVRLPPG